MHFARLIAFCGHIGFKCSTVIFSYSIMNGNQFRDDCYFGISTFLLTFAFNHYSCMFELYSIVIHVYFQFDEVNDNKLL